MITDGVFPNVPPDDDMSFAAYDMTPTQVGGWEGAWFMAVGMKGVNESNDPFAPSSYGLTFAELD